MQIIRYILFPIALVYGVIVEVIKWFYQKNIFKIHYSNTAILNVGNLSTGGTGKTPHVAYLMELLSSQFKTVVLSRGYNRKTKGAFWVKIDSNTTEVGDEPLELKMQFPKTPIIVSEKRALALPLIQKKYPKTQLILLDDALQHWALHSPFKILLTTFDQPFFKDYVLPMGNLREFRKGYQRADIIVVTKCPATIDYSQKSSFQKAIALKPHQKIFFSYYEYVNPKVICGENELSIKLLKTIDVIVVTAIAATSYLEEFIIQNCRSWTWIKYPDHHYFKEKDISNIVKQFRDLKSENKIVLTTAKDAMRLKLHQNLLEKKEIPLYSLPIRVKFAFEEEQEFGQAVLDLLEKKGNL